MEPIKWLDTYRHTKECTMLTENELQIPGIRLFAMRKIQSALPPLPLHYHENAFEITFIDKGSMSFSCDDKNYNVPGGCIFVSFPNEPHSTNNVPITLNEQYWFQLDIHDPHKFLFLNKDTALEYIRNLNKLDHMLEVPDTKQLRSIIKYAFELASKGGNRYLIAGCFTILLQLLIEAETRSSYTPPDFENVLQYVEDHLTEEISLDFLAAQCRLSTSHFKQKFRNIVGISPRNYINQCKINHAKELLLSGKPITEVAMELGFNTSSYFSAVFKKYTLQTPREFMKSQEER